MGPPRGCRRVRSNPAGPRLLAGPRESCSAASLARAGPRLLARRWDGGGSPSLALARLSLPGPWRSARAEWLEWREGWPLRGRCFPPPGRQGFFPHPPPPTLSIVLLSQSVSQSACRQWSTQRSPFRLKWQCHQRRRRRPRHWQQLGRAPCHRNRPQPDLQLGKILRHWPALRGQPTGIPEKRTDASACAHDTFKYWPA